MKKALWILTVFFAVGTLIFCLMGESTETLAITFGTTLYHFVMRLAVGGLVLRRTDYATESGWFAQKKWEKKLYSLLRVKKWKGLMPTYDPKEFDAGLEAEQLVRNMCHAELVHEWIMLLSFVPLIGMLLFKAPMAFLFTSIAAACFDALFVILQRYNRPRVLLLLKRQQRQKEQRC